MLSDISRGGVRMKGEGSGKREEGREREGFAAEVNEICWNENSECGGERVKKDYLESQSTRTELSIGYALCNFSVVLWGFL